MAATARGEPTSDVPDLPRDIEVRPLPEFLAHALREGEGRAVLTSSRGTQRSWERPDNTHGIFTYHLLEALQGAGNQPGDNMVHLSNLQNYLGRKVSETARNLCRAEQTPFFDLASEDFPIALLRGGRGLPAGGWEAVKHETRYDPPPNVQVGTMSGGNIQVGDRKVEQHGKYNLNADTISGSAIGDDAKVVNGKYVEGDQFNFQDAQMQGAILNIKSTLSNVTQSIGTAPHLDPTTKDEFHAPRQPTQHYA